MANVIGPSVPSWTALKANREISPSLHELAKRPGAPIVATSAAADAPQKPGQETREHGYLAHVRWFYPDPDDLVPFLALLLLRTPLNFTAIAEAQIEPDWHTPYDFNMSHKTNEFVYVWFNKVRGRRNRLDDPKPVFAVSPVTPRSFPFQIRIFLEELTYDLRKEVRDQIAILAVNPIPNMEELNRLRAIENDLFLYRSYRGINSLRHVIRAGQVPAFLANGLRRYGISAGVMRGNNLAFSYNFSGQNLASITYLAMHRDRNLAILYARRDNSIKKTEELFRNIFEHSITLIASDVFDIDNLKLLLEAQKWNDEQIGNLLDPDTLTRWGNRCADPLKPPKGFERDTPPGQCCRGQNCVDGCPSARWFKDSARLIGPHIEEMKRKLADKSFTEVAAGSLLSKISRLEYIAEAMKKGSH